MIGFIKTIILNWYRQPINPILLELRDKELHSKFQTEARSIAIKRAKNFGLILAVFCTSGAVANSQVLTTPSWYMLSVSFIF